MGALNVAPAASDLFRICPPPLFPVSKKTQRKTEESNNKDANHCHPPNCVATARSVFFTMVLSERFRYMHVLIYPHKKHTGISGEGFNSQSPSKGHRRQNSAQVPWLESSLFFFLSLRLSKTGRKTLCGCSGQRLLIFARTLRLLFFLCASTGRGRKQEERRATSTHRSDTWAQI